MSKNKKMVIESSSESNTKSSESDNTYETDSTPIPSTSTNEIVSDSENESDDENASNYADIDKTKLEAEFNKLDCTNEKLYTNECNKFLLKKEFLEYENFSKNKEDTPYLYPNLNDKEFNIKIATKKEFNDTKYDGTIYEDIKKQADILANADFELQPHQAFVKNFMSFQTPYSSLLLYHGLGSGKTCSAIGVCEEMRDYMKQMGITKRIIIVASENVQDNFKLQLFDERKLKLINGVWSMRGCVGNKLLKEINPMNMPMSKEKVISQIKNLINTYYIFLGYVQFANYIIKTMNYEEELKKKFDKKQKENKKKSRVEILTDVKIELNSRIIRRLRNEFDNRLIVIDEVHNIRKTDDNENKKVAINLELLVKSALNMRFLLLSATPMYNSYKEIVWLLNLMNTNDRRGRIDVRDIFDKNGDFKKNGEELLIRKATGYISFVRGENPYTFPYRIYPNEFAKEYTFPAVEYPSYQMNLKKIGHEDKKRILSLYLTTIGNCKNCGKCQYCCYKYIIHHLRNKKFTITTKQGVIRDMPSFENMESFGYTLLQTPLESLIISYPVSGLKEILDELPDEDFSDEISPSFSEQNVKNVPAEIIEPVDSVLSRKNSEQEDQELESELETELEPELEHDFNNTDNNIVDDVVIDNVVGCITNELNKNYHAESDKKEEIIEEVVKAIKNANKRRLVIDSSSTENSIDRKLLKNKETEVKDLEELEDLEPESDASESYEPDLRINQRSHQGLGTFGGRNSKHTDSSSSVNVAIDPHQLTGKIGLERMMTFIDSKSPPAKGDFEYKSTTLKTYGKIFSQPEIGNYSAKIKSILDKIYNLETQKVSDGIILIYSQYIDSGLIPVALALEEMGFTRFGQQGIKPLFKNRPSEVVDVRTMQPPTDKKNFKPARYSMITGDSRLSPNNDFEVKGLTSEDNKDGSKVKVVLISKAGSEGIDLKFIRQVHILDPWYNMNRPEQIIGRAVRNFSHKDLPFEQRNVQIFMYGTILDTNKEEAADLYVYRVAEHKAVQIGKITRILKETAVDCIINQEQTNFTQTIMKASLKEPIIQELSTGEVLKEFKVGDAPFSPACDYMASCNYNCRPDADIDSANLNEDTYDENFIIMNSDKILQRIRMLFKESFFYKKDSLLKAIRTPKEYPYVQIYSALTQLIEDENEFIVDRYGRNGRLVNIGDYYLFQPIELKNKNISIFERSVPLDFKHSMVNFELKKEIAKPAVIDKRTLNVETEMEEHPRRINENSEGKQIIEKMKEHFEITKEFIGKRKVDRGDDNWFKHSGIVITKMSKEYPESQKYLLSFLVAHMIEMLMFNDKINLLNYIYSLDNIEQNSVERYVKNYFENNTIVSKEYTVFIAYNLNKRMIMMLDNDNQWVEATPEDQREIASLAETKSFLQFDPAQYNNVVGFIGYEKGNKDLAFKTKNMSSKRDTGARCDQATKNKNMQRLNEILGEEKYTTENTRIIKDKQGNVEQEAVGNVELCVMEEFVLRFFNETTKDNKKWFLTPEMAIWNKLYTVFV